MATKSNKEKWEHPAAAAGIHAASGNICVTPGDDEAVTQQKLTLCIQSEEKQTRELGARCMITT